MGYYSQHTPGYDRIKLGTCAQSLWDVACFMTSFCNLGKEREWFDINPVSMNKLFIKEKLFSGGCNFVAPAVAKHFGLTYEKLLKDPGVLCIAETNKYAPKVPQHFFLYDNGMIIDPLDPPEKIKWKKNTYPIVSYRVFKKPVVKIDQKVKETPKSEPVKPAEQPETHSTMQETAQVDQLPQSDTNIPVETKKTEETAKNDSQSEHGSLLGMLITALVNFFTRR